jgi:hypothetical protein
MPPPFNAPRTTAFGAFLEGYRRVWYAPALLAGIATTCIVLLLPHRLSVFGTMSDDWGLRTLLERALWEWHGGWALALGGRTTPSAPGLASTTAVGLLLWMFLAGGILDRVARARPIRTAAFFAACGQYFMRFIRLSLLLAPAYWWLFGWLHPYLLTTVLPQWTAGMTMRRDIIAAETTVHLGFLLAVGMVTLVADYARVRAVVEDRRSMLGAIAAALRFMRRRPGRVVGLYLISALPAAAVIRLWFGASAVPDGSAAYGATILTVYLVLRVWTRLAWMASEVVFFQGELAHASYTAAPLPLWPESPAAEALENLTMTSPRG